MKITFYDKYSAKSYSISPMQSVDSRDDDQIWISNEGHEGGQFSVDEVSDVIYQALHKYFKENY